MSFQTFSKISLRSLDDKRPEAARSAAEFALFGDGAEGGRVLPPEEKLWSQTAESLADPPVPNAATRLHARTTALREMRLLLGRVGRVISRVSRTSGIIGTRRCFCIPKL